MEWTVIDALLTLSIVIVLFFYIMLHDEYMELKNDLEELQKSLENTKNEFEEVQTILVQFIDVINKL